MSNELTVVERTLTEMSPVLSAALPPQAAGLPVERLIRTVVISCERVPRLLECNRQSLINSAVSAAVLGLEVDGVTGQAYLIPYQGNATLQIGFKGHETIAARSGFIFESGVIREGDEYEVTLGSDSRIAVTPQLGDRLNRRVIAAYAVAKSNTFPSVHEVMAIDEIEKARAVSKAQRTDAPWNQWFDQMAIKTVKKRLAKSLPLLSLHLASALDDAPGSYIAPDGAGVGNLMKPAVAERVYPERVAAEPGDLTSPKFTIRMKKREVQCPTIDEYVAKMQQAITSISDPAKVEEFFKLNEADLAKLYEHEPWQDKLSAVYTAYMDAQRGVRK